MVSDRDRLAIHTHLQRRLKEAFEDIPQCMHSAPLITMAGTVGVAFGVQAMLADPTLAKTILDAILSGDADQEVVHQWRIEQDLAQLREVLKS